MTGPKNGNGGLRVPRWAIYAGLLLGSIAVAAFEAGQRVGQERVQFDNKLSVVDSNVTRLVRRVCRLEEAVTDLTAVIEQVHGPATKAMAPPDLDCR